MAKINQIQNAIQELEGGAFQKLADHYLTKKGYLIASPTGSVAGNNKVKKGTPDSFFWGDDNEGYIFCEYTTTSKKQIFKKLLGDISKCLDESKTNISVNKIKEIVLCCTTDLSVEEFDKLRERCELDGVNLSIYGLGLLSYDLLEKYPGLAKSYLGIEVDTGQIVPMDTFLSMYEKSKLAATLKTTFRFRTEERNEILKGLADEDVVIITGSAGVGKSRIAIECFQSFIKDNDIDKAYCIFNQGADLYDDIQSYFSDSGNYLIFIDDANRVSGFKYLVNLLLMKREDQSFKLVVTVRDYALSIINNLCLPLKSVAKININSFADNEIVMLMDEEFGIRNSIYVNRIVDIAQGNPRVAVMAAQVINEKGTLESIRDVTELYDLYYSSVKSDLEMLEDENALKISGLVSFFRFVDRSNEGLMHEIESLFNIKSSDFWKGAERLHNIEVLDMFENSVVKISDQVLATYLFYYVFFKKKILNLSVVIYHLFPEYKQQLIEVINPILNVFNFEDIKRSLEGPVDDAWSDLKVGGAEKFEDFVDVFWFMKPTDTMLYMRSCIDDMEQQSVAIKDVKFEPGGSSCFPKFLSTISLLSYLGTNECKLSLELLLDFAVKQQKFTAGVLSCLIEGYGFRPESYTYDYYVQNSVVNKLIELSDGGKNEYYTRLFVALAKEYLKTNYSRTKSGRGSSIIISNYSLVKTESLSVMRENMLSHLFGLYGNTLYRDQVITFLYMYTQYGSDLSVNEIVQDESELIMNFIKSKLKTSNIYHCHIVQKYIRLLEGRSIKLKGRVKSKFNPKEYQLYELFTHRLETIEPKLKYEEFLEYKQKEIYRFIERFSVEEIKKILKQLHLLLMQLDSHSVWQIKDGVVVMFEALLSNDFERGYAVLEDYLLDGDSVEIIPERVVFGVLTIAEPRDLLKAINLGEYRTKDRWLFCVYKHIHEKDISHEYLESLLKLYKVSEVDNIIENFDYLLKYESVQEGYVLQVVHTLVERAESNQKIGFVLDRLFNRHTRIFKQLETLFKGNFPLLENTYFVADRVDKHTDYDGRSFSILLDNDYGFIDRWLTELFSRKEYLSRHDESRDYSFIWHRHDYMDVMQHITDFIVSMKCKHDYHCWDFYEVFFSKGNHAHKNESIIDSQNNYLCSTIAREANNDDYIGVLFSVIATFEPSRKLIFYKAFLKKNKTFKSFKKLRFEPGHEGWTGSAVPMLQKRVDFLGKITEICNCVELLKHKQHIENIIKGIRSRIEGEKKRDFTESI